MRIFPPMKRAQLQEMARRVSELEGEVGRYREVQELLVKDILSLQEVERTYKGNDYQDYAEAVQAISDKYCNIDDWGCTQTGAIIDLRSAFILGEGVQVSPTTESKSEAQNEMDWVKDFMSYNGLDAEMAQEIVKEAEIEGKVALNIFYDEKAYDDDPERKKRWPGMVSVRFIPWSEKKYKVETDPKDYLWYKKITWDAQGTAPAGFYEEDRFVYKKFGGRIYDPDDAQPKIMKCLTQVDRLDRALTDLRKINHLFASPTPDFQMDDAESVKKLEAKISSANWKIGKLFIHTGMFSYKSPDAAGLQMLLSEIEMCIKIISGTTGIPIHYLGLLDLLKNRATGENTRELVMAATTKERQTWIGAYTELLEKAMRLFNQEAGLSQRSVEKQLNPKRISVGIPEMTQEHWDHIEKVLIPAAAGGIVSKEFVASQIPGVDMEAEAERKQQRDEEEEAKAATELERLKEEAALGGNGNGKEKEEAWPPGR